MKKVDKQAVIILRNKREKKRLEKIRNPRHFQGSSSLFSREQIFKEKIDKKLIQKFHYNLFDFFKEINFIEVNDMTTSTLIIPPIFSLRNNYSQSMNVIKEFASGFFDNLGKVFTIDFEKCTEVDQSALFLFQVLKLDFQDDLEKLASRLHIIDIKRSIKIIESKKSEDVNKLLFVNGLIRDVELKNVGLMPFSTLGFMKGTKTRKHYIENKKGLIATRVVEYTNECLAEHDFTINPMGKNYLGGLISEILNNAEDHSPCNTYYTAANFLKENSDSNKDGIVGELNLSFLNFGYSIYKGFEDTMESNIDMYNSLDALFDQVRLNNANFSFSKENMFTLYSLQDGVSRLKYDDPSRGTGTIKFLNSFFAIGDYEDKKKRYIPSLEIFSGKTHVICDNKYQPFLKDDYYFISLNSKKDLSLPPDKDNLIKLTINFPGTMLSVKIYLNKSHLSKKQNIDEAH